MRGMYFRPYNVKAIREGRKTVTRRVINPQPQWLDTAWYWRHPRYDNGDGVHYLHSTQITDSILDAMKNCARYRVGEILYLKEKALYWTGGAGGTSDVIYSDDPEIPHLIEDNNRLLMARETTNILEGESVIGKWKWRSPLFMPQWAARDFIKILDVRAERLHEISPTEYATTELEREGIPYKNRFGIDFTTKLERYVLLEDFSRLWNSINPKYPWESNPWVWRYEFEVVEK